MKKSFMQQVSIHRWVSDGKFDGSIIIQVDGASMTMKLNDTEISQIEVIAAGAVEREKHKKAKELAEFSAIPAITYDSNKTIDQDTSDGGKDDDFPF